MIKLSSFSPSARFSLCLASLLALAIAAQPNILQAETINTEEWQIEADKLLHFDNPKSVIAEGNVVLTKLRVLPPKQSVAKIQTSSWSNLLEETSEIVKEVATQETDKNTALRYKTEITIKADWIAYDVENSSIKAKGNIIVQDDTDQLLAERLRNNNKGRITGRFFFH